MHEAVDPDRIKGASLHATSACTVDKESGINACWPKCISLAKPWKSCLLEGCFDKLKVSTKETVSVVTCILIF